MKADTNKQARTKIFLTEAEIDNKLDDLEFEIEDIVTHKHMKDGDLPTGTLDRMLKSRVDKMKALKRQPVVVKDDKTKNCLDLKELIFSEANNNDDGLIFLTGRLSTGHFIGFWSHSPCSTTRNQEKGWAIVDPEKLEIIDTCTTCSMGTWSGNFREWRKSVKDRFGKTTILHDGLDTSTPVWKMED